MTCKLKFICGADLAHQSLAFAFCSSHFSYVHGDLMARMLKWFAISFSSGPVCQNPPPWPVSRLALHGMAHSFIELHKAVIHVIILVSFLWLGFHFGGHGIVVLTSSVSVLKSKDIILPTKFCLVKTVVFPVVMYRCESWTIKKSERQRIDAFQLWCWKRLLRVPWTERRSNQIILKEINPEYSVEGLMLRLKL